MSSVNLPPIKNHVKFTKSTKSISALDTENVSKSRRKSGVKKSKEFDPDKIAAEVRYAQLQSIFGDAEDGLNIKEFKRAMRETLGNKMTDDEIELLFMKVDANCDGVVDWEEYVTYNLLEYQGKSLMKEMMKEIPFPHEPKEIPSRHREVIVSILFYPNVRRRDGRCFIDHTNGRYVTISKEGILSIWNVHMKFITSYNTISEIGDRATQPWLIDLACIYNVGMVAISSTDRDITVFDLQGNNFRKKYHLIGLDDCITCMHYWVDLNDMNEAKLLWGDTSGSVCVIVFKQCLRGGLFGSFGVKKGGFKRISLPEVIRGFYKGARGYRFNRVHSDWVLRLRYIPELTAFISCSQTSENSLCVYEIGKKKTNSMIKINKGILCFDYCPGNNIIVTGGMDYCIRAWNPKINAKSMYVLKGYTKPINQVVINSRKSQIIGIDKRRTIRVYDMKDQSCLQHVSGRVVKLGKVPLSAVYFNPVLQTLIIATNHLAVLQKSNEEERAADIESHTKPVVCVLYNELFKFVVSACQDSVISVWDLYTGEKVIHAANAHVREEKGIIVPVEITSMAFDGPLRRVITGAMDGSIKVWNFNNGSCLQTFNTPDGVEITGIVSINHRIFATGWSRKMHIFIDGRGEEHRKDWRQKHNEDILCMSYLSPNIIATGAYDGDVVVWSRDTGHVYCTLNAGKSIKPIGDTKNKNKDGRPDTSQSGNSEAKSSELGFSFNIFENLASEEMLKKRVRKASFLHKNIDILNRVKGNVLMKENKWSQKIGRLDDTPVEHPLLPLYRNQEDSPVDGTNQKPPSRTASRREDYDELCKMYESSIECILFLESRDRESEETAILITSGAEGWIRAWSIYHQGGLLGQFNAAHKVGEGVHTMCTDEKNKLLFTADSCGYVKMWDLSEYCTKKALTKARRAKRWKYLNDTFTFVNFSYCYEQPPEILISSNKMPSNINNRPPPASSLPKITLKWPLLVNSYRAHTKIINKMEYVEGEKLLITASSDCAIRLWTLNGLYIGTFGETWESIPKLLKQMSTTNVRIPSDLRRSGSASTLKVLNGGRSGLWQQALDGAKKIIRDKAEEVEFEKKLQEEKAETKSPCDDGDGPETARSIPSSRPKPKQTGGVFSDILGKSYKKTMRHKMPPKMDKFVEINSSIAVYRCLPFSELNVDNDPEQMKRIDELRTLYFGGSLLSKMKGNLYARNREKGPAFAGLYNKITQRQPLPKGINQAGRIKRAQNKVKKTPASVLDALTIKEFKHETDTIDKILKN
ncbi:WD repeat-containing protein on Y chromosome-like [Mytilus trossulus]|uniref:WD repeat-containing protein on Y chromosome-like n=1 Tax=Mytilus trossulus TaxID=6551 RepID=UPI0030046B42